MLLRIAAENATERHFSRLGVCFVTDQFFAEVRVLPAVIVAVCVTRTCPWLSGAAQGALGRCWVCLSLAKNNEARHRVCTGTRSRLQSLKGIQNSSHLDGSVPIALGNWVTTIEEPVRHGER